MKPGAIWYSRERTLSAGAECIRRYGFGTRIAVPTVEDAVECFREMMGCAGPRADFLRESLHELRGKNLACWCRLDDPCHADVLLELANRPIRCEAA